MAREMWGKERMMLARGEDGVGVAMLLLSGSARIFCHCTGSQKSSSDTMKKRIHWMINRISVHVVILELLGIVVHERLVLK